MRKRKIHLSLLMVIFLMTVMFSGCGQKLSESVSTSSTASLTSIPNIALASNPTATPIVTPTVKPTSTPTATPTVKPTEIPTVKPTVKPTLTQTVKPTPTPTVIPETQDANVYKTKTGEKYHLDGCSYLSKSKIPIKLSDAKAEGLTPCSRCNPPR